jgi:hypothetical protein
MMAGVANNPQPALLPRRQWGRLLVVGGEMIRQ